MARVHLIMQGKGGVGKSMVAALLAQYFRARGVNPLCIDTDPINSTFARYAALEVQELAIMDGDEINVRKFDMLVESVVETDRSNVIVDNGASSFVALSSYLIANQVPSLLSDMGHELAVHTIITGGQALMDCLDGFDDLAKQLPVECHFVVWLNPYWGPVEHKGKQFESMQAYKTHRGRITSIVEIQRMRAEMHGQDFSEMLREQKTFEEAIVDCERTVMTRQRLKTTQRDLFSRMDSARLMDLTESSAA